MINFLRGCAKPIRKFLDLLCCGHRINEFANVTLTYLKLIQLFENPLNTFICVVNCPMDTVLMCDQTTDQVNFWCLI